MFEAFDLLQAQSQQFTGLESSINPLSLRLLVPFAAFTEVNGYTFSNTSCDVDTCPETVDAHVGRIEVDDDATFATETVGEMKC